MTSGHPESDDEPPGDPRDRDLEAPDNLGAPPPSRWSPEVERELERDRARFRLFGDPFLAFAVLLILVVVLGAIAFAVGIL